MLKNILYQPYKWLIFCPLGIIATIVSATMTSVVSFFSHKRAFWWGQWWAEVIQALVPMRIKVSGRENIDKNQSYVIVANHQSAFDIIAIYGNMHVNFRWIMKQELRKAPLIGWACWNGKHIFIDRSSKRASYRSLQRAKEILRDGISVVIFPEGTRTYNNDLGRFKSGGFKLAFQLGLPLLPVTLIDTHKVMGKSFFSLQPHRAEMIIHKPINTMDYVDRIDELMEDTHKIMEHDIR